jgi:hypothetical protein
MKEFYNLLIFVAICFVVYLVFRTFQYNPMLIEGMTDASGNENTITSSENGLAGNAATYAASLKADTIRALDTLLISKYRGDYESAILNLDDTINVLMLQTALTFDKSNPQNSVEKLSKMQQAKVALNSVMKFVDTQ